MNYFSNNTMFDIYENTFCNRCVHGNGKYPIVMLHYLWNYDQHSDSGKPVNEVAYTVRVALNAFIPKLDKPP